MVPSKHLIPMETALSISHREGFVAEMAILHAFGAVALHEVQTVYLRVVHLHPSRFKTVRLPGASGGRLMDSDIAVTVHGCACAGSVIQADPAQCSSNNVFVLHGVDCMDYHNLKAAAVWDVESQYVMLGRTYPPPTKTQVVAEDELLRHLLGESALAPDDLPTLAANLVESKEEDVALCLSLEGDRPELTQRGKRLLNVVYGLANPSPALVVRSEMHLGDLSLHELITQTLAEGWAWQELPKRRSEKLQLSYKAGDPKIAYYAANVTPHKLYVICLIRSVDLCSDGKAIPHWTDTPAKVRCSGSRKTHPTRKKIPASSLQLGKHSSE